MKWLEMAKSELLENEDLEGADALFIVMFKAAEAYRDALRAKGISDPEDKLLLQGLKENLDMSRPQLVPEVRALIDGFICRFGDKSVWQVVTSMNQLGLDIQKAIKKGK